MKSRAVLTGLAAATLTMTVTACSGSAANTSTGMAGMGSTQTAPAATSGAATMPASTMPASTSSMPMSGMAMSPSATFNGQDVTFSTDMIDHHRQAVAMAQLAPKRTTTKAVLALAKAIEAAQGPEITKMSGWLTGWGKPIPEDMGGMDMGGSMPGMMSMAQLDKLAAAKGTAFDKQFLTLMIAHHQGAVTMAKTQIAKGHSTQVSAMAKKVITDQSAEITRMRALLG
jgi:uncharacterized protein (DUF305 family)